MLNEVCATMAESGARAPATTPIRQYAVDSSSWRLRYVNDLVGAIACICFAQSYRWIGQVMQGPNRGAIWFIAGHPHDIAVAKILLPFLRAESYKAYYRVQSVIVSRRDRTLYREWVQESFAARTLTYCHGLLKEWDHRKYPSYFDMKLYRKKAGIVSWMYENHIHPIKRLSRSRKLPYNRARYLWCNEDVCMRYQNYVKGGRFAIQSKRHR